MLRYYKSNIGDTDPSEEVQSSASGPTQGAAAAAPPPFRLGDPALSGSNPMVTPC